MRKKKALAMVIMVAGLITTAKAQVDPDYGWGVYNSLTHGVTGDSIYIIKGLDGSYKQLWITEKISVQNRYIFRYADLDGSHEQEVDLAMNDYAGRLFLYFSLSDDAVVDVQPEAADWDLLLTKFNHPGLGYYVVTGFLANEDVRVCVFHAPDSATAAEATIADTTAFTDSIAGIGNSWYELQGMSIVPLDTLAYFVKLPGGDIYKLQVTYFESGMSGQGRVGIRKMKVSDPPDVAWQPDTLVMGPFYANEIFYKLDTGTPYPVSRDGWEIAFKTAQFTASITANTTMGVELYTYPKADTSAWIPSTSTGPALEEGSGISLYPVPATDYLFVRYHFTSRSPLNFHVYDLTGKKLLDLPAAPSASREQRLDISGLAPGTYILEVKNTAVRAVGRFTKSR
jgi:hypothetical protein